MPYIMLNLVRGGTSEAKQQALKLLSEKVCEVLGAGLSHTHAYLQEFETSEIFVGGKPASGVHEAALVTVVMSRGRPPVVLRRLIATVTDVVEASLKIPRDAVHCVLQENEASDIAVAGVPLAFPQMPKWLLEEQV